MQSIDGQMEQQSKNYTPLAEEKTNLGWNFTQMKADPQPTKRVTGDLPKVYATLMPFRKRNKRYFILDSGASFHLVDEATLTPGERNNLRPLLEPFTRYSKRQG